ncbi:MAG TPA: hypothetical protein ENH82_15415, partial [bacterium]|nr:hypothetical protein [bacterium]
AIDGSVLWHHPYDNFQLVLRGDELYAFSGQRSDKVSVKIDALTGKILEEFDVTRRACTRPNGAADAIFFRTRSGSIRFDLESSRSEYVSPMRPNCHDGVTIANGLLYWWPMPCDCLLTLYGAICLGPAGDFNFSPAASENERLEKNVNSTDNIADIASSAADWHTFRANNTGSAKSDATIPKEITQLWEYAPKTPITPTTPVTAGGLVFVSGSDGIVRALDSATGKENWKFYTGGSVRLSPTIWNNRAFVGSGDGWVYSLEAKTGRQLWRFRAAPVERKMPVYGKLLSTWPAASGVLVEDGTAYFAAGISNFDGIHVYALDAESGEIK